MLVIRENQKFALFDVNRGTWETTCPGSLLENRFTAYGTTRMPDKFAKTKICVTTIVPESAA